jgi:uncharacterized protein
MRLCSATVGSLALLLGAACLDSPSTAPQLPLLSHVGNHPAVRFSEIHYDNSGTDAGEAIEISGPAGTDLTGWSIVLYNGTGGAAYSTTPLTGTIPATCSPRGVVTVTYSVNGIQNGAPDGMALVSPGGVIEFLSYEGAFTAADGPAIGLLSTDIGVSENGSDPVGRSLARNGDGSWNAPAVSGFGTCNDNIEPPPPPPVDHVIVTPAQASIFTGQSQVFVATAYDENDQPVAGIVFTWTSSAPGVATVNPSGSATALAPGDALIKATSADGKFASGSLHVDALGLPATRFSELHYDNTGTDVGEAIEIEGPAGTDLTGWSVLLYNGSGGALLRHQGSLRQHS